MNNDEKNANERSERGATNRFSANREVSSDRGASERNVGEPVQAARLVDAEPFAFVELERKTSDFLVKVRDEARRVAEETRLEIVALKEETERGFREERVALDQLALELDERRRRLETEERERAEKLAATERETFEKAREEGFRRGFDEGKIEGARLAKEESDANFKTVVAKEVETKTKTFCEEAVAPIRQLIREMTGVRQSLLKHWEENAMQIAAAIAYQTIMRDPATGRDVPLDLLREALELAMNCAALKIRMNPRDVDNLRDEIRGILEETGNLATAEVVADSKITSGGCVVESSLGVIDERLESRLERIVAELSD